jgi:DNA-binding SARP family transcriptional activator
VEKVCSLRANFLGTFSVAAVLPDGREVSLTDGIGRSNKLRIFMEYLAFHHDREIPHGELFELLWPDGETGNPMSALKLIVLRARAELGGPGPLSGKEIIVNRRGSYAWGSSFRTVLDTNEFEDLCRMAAKEDGERRLEYMLRAVSVYRGDFLPQSASESWVMPLASYYHDRYINLCLTAVSSLEEENRFDDIAAVCRQAVAIDPRSEPLHMVLIRALYASGATQEALDHYRETASLLMDRFGITPSEAFSSLYRQISGRTDGPEADLGEVRKRLSEGRRAPGAFYCDFEFFKDIYRQKAREYARTDQTVQLAMITMDAAGGGEPDPRQFGHLAELLRSSIQSSLRSGDVFTRSSAPQFLLMLPAASFENAGKILERIGRHFRGSYPRSGVELRYSVLPMEPAT